MTDHQTSFFPTGRDRGVTGGGLAVLLTAAGVVLATRTAGRLRVMADPAARRRYGIIVGLEFGLLAFCLATLLAGRPLYGDPSDGLRLPRSQSEGEA